MNRPDLLIFDLDGTLLDTLNTIAEAFNQSLKDMGCPPHPIVDYRHIVGDGVAAAAERSLPADRRDEIDTCIERFRHYYSENWRDARPYDGIVPLLDSLKSQAKLAVLSNKDEVFTRQIIDHALPGYFELVVGFRPPFRYKPDPASGLWIMKELNVPAGNTWFVGDTATDMRTAIACNMTGVGVLWGFRDKRELQESGATLLVQTPKALAESFETAS